MCIYIYIFGRERLGRGPARGSGREKSNLEEGLIGTGLIGT